MNLLDLSKVVHMVSADAFTAKPVWVLSRGSGEITAPEFFGLRDMRAFFDITSGSYDIIMIDAPPLLQVA